MSTFFKLIKGAAKSNTIQFNGGFLGILLMLMQSEAFNGIISKNPEWTAIAFGIQAVINILLRGKTKKPLADR